MTVEIFALLPNTIVSKDIGNHSYFKRFADAISEIGGVANCIMGLPKDLKAKIKENLVIVKVLQGNSQEQALRECQKIVWGETLEANRHANLLLQTFPDDEDNACLRNYIKHSFNLVNNYTQFHIAIKGRYMT
jgi:isochorismate hydrolase